MFLTLHKYSNFGISRLFWCGSLTPQPIKPLRSQLLFPTRLGYVSFPIFEGFCMKICTFFFAIFGKHYKNQSGRSYISYINKLMRAFVRPSRRKFYLFGLGNRIESKEIR